VTASYKVSAVTSTTPRPYQFRFSSDGQELNAGHRLSGRLA
jgi:hypothetical protein